MVLTVKNGNASKGIKNLPHVHRCRYQLAKAAGACFLPGNLKADTNRTCQKLLITKNTKENLVHRITMIIP